MMLSFVYLLVLALIVLAALGVGRPVICALTPADERDELSELVWSVAAGWVTVGTLLLGLGLVGLLYPWLIRTLTLLAASFGLIQLGPLWRTRRLRLAGWRTMREPGGIEHAEVEPGESPRPWLVGGGRWMLVMIGGATLLSALAPPSAGDALTYHLELPKRFLLEHAVIELPHDDNAVYPLLAEMGFLWGLALGGGTTAQLMHWLCGVLLAGGVYLLGSPILGRRWSELAAALTLLTPGVNNQMTAPLNDLAVTTFTTLALAAWQRGVQGEPAGHEARASAVPQGWYLLAGVFLGAALGTKHVALLFVAALGVVTLWRIVRQPQLRRPVLAGSAAMMIVASSLAGPWYLRAAWHRGDPLYPFLTQQFAAQHSASSDSAAIRSSGAGRVQPDKRPLGRSALAAITAPWQVTMQPERVGGRAHQLGPLALMLLPCLAVSRRLRGLGVLLAIAGLFVLLWFVLRQNVRFLLPAVPLAAVGCVWPLIEWRRWPSAPRSIAALAVLSIVLFSLAIPVRRAVKTLPVALGIESRDDYLRRVEPTYDMARQMFELGLFDARVLSQEQRAFYLPGRITRESIYRRHTRYDHALAPGSLTAESIVGQLRSAGFTHMLLVDAHGGETTYDDTLSRLLADQRDDPLRAETKRTLRSVCESTHRDTTGGERRYRLVDLADASAP